MIIVYLTCGSDKEAKKIGKALLEAKLVACVRRFEVQSNYWWDKKLEQNYEVMMIMESVEKKFDAINSIVAKMHSYDEPALSAVTVTKTTTGVVKWLDDSLLE